MGILKCATTVLDQWFSNLNVHQNHPTGLLKKKKNRSLFTRASDSVALGWGPSGGGAAAV